MLTPATPHNPDKDTSEDGFSHTKPQYQPSVFKNKSYKAIHYERQTQLRFRHIFNPNPFYTQLRYWCSTIKTPYKPGNTFMLQFDFTLPERRKIKRRSKVFDLTSTKEYEAAHTGLMYARSMFDIFVDELYKWSRYTFDKGLQIGPSWVEGDKVKTCAVLILPTFPPPYRDITVADVLVFAAQTIFSADDLNHMQQITARVYFNTELLGIMDIGTESNYEPAEVVEEYYSCEQIQRILYSRVENRNVLYAFRTEGNQIRQGMMIKTDTIWKPVEIRKREDIYTSVKGYNVIEFIPAVNRVGEEYPSVITIETDPGDMFVTALGPEKSWIVNTYVTEKILQILDRYKIRYTVKFSGNKGWHIVIPVEFNKPLPVYQDVVEAIVNKELGSLPDEEKIPAMMANVMQLEDVRSYKDPFFVARRFVDLIGAHVMFYELADIHTVLTLDDVRRLCLRVRPVSREDLLRKGSDIFESERGPVKAEIPQVVSINPYSRFRRQFKLLIDHSSNKKEGKLRSILSLHSKSGLASVPALLREEKGITRIDKRMWDYNFVCDVADPENVLTQLENKSDYTYPLQELAQKWEVNTELTGFNQFLEDHKGLLVYLLQNGGEALELLDSPTAVWVNAHLWERTVNKL